MTLRPCLGHQGHTCTRLTPHGNRCTEHQRMYEQARRPTPGARQRGYDAAHEAARARAVPAAYGSPCPRCGELMLQGQALDYGHRVARSVDPSSRADRVEHARFLILHARCNRSVGARGDPLVA